MGTEPSSLTKGLPGLARRGPSEGLPPAGGATAARGASPEAASTNAPAEASAAEAPSTVTASTQEPAEEHGTEGCVIGRIISVVSVIALPTVAAA